MSAPVRARVIALGQPSAGDDGVGVAVLAALRARALPPDVELSHLSDATALVSLLDSPVPIILVDAVLASPAGQVVELGPDELASSEPLRMSSHGLGITEAIGLARALSDGADVAPVRIVAITIKRPERYGHGLSDEALAAVPVAAARVLSLLETDHA